MTYKFFRLGSNKPDSRCAVCGEIIRRHELPHASVYSASAGKDPRTGRENFAYAAAHTRCAGGDTKTVGAGEVKFRRVPQDTLEVN